MNITDPISLSISIVCFNSEQGEVLRLLESVASAYNVAKESHRLDALSIFIIDNSSKDKTIQFEKAELKGHFASQGLTFYPISGHGNIGYGRAQNLVLEELTSDFHLILNPDLRFSKDCLVKGLEYLLNTSHVVLASPQAQDFSGRRQHLCRRYPSILTLLIRGFFPKPWHKPFSKRLSRYEMHELDFESEAHQIIEEPVTVSGCFMLCRTHALKKVGGFDCRYFLYFEDFDLSLRMSKLGKIAYLPEMKIVHGGGNAAKKGWRHILMFIRSGIRFYNTHGWRWFKQ